MTAVFADTFYFLALLNKKDTAHLAAAEYSRAATKPLLTTTFVLTELADALADPRSRQAFAKTIHLLRANTANQVIHPNETQFDDASRLYDERLDKGVVTDGLHFIRDHERIRRFRGLVGRQTLQSSRIYPSLRQAATFFVTPVIFADKRRHHQNFGKYASL
ncbi:MAG: hypothetical protein SGI88_11270 [Candidatus Hydrogenedentes bacterium]|nr:hypothetical protein [Candidatus Hydrogenedentota bacterium]